MGEKNTKREARHRVNHGEQQSLSLRLPDKLESRPVAQLSQESYFNLLGQSLANIGQSESSMVPHRKGGGSSPSLDPHSSSDEQMSSEEAESDSPYDHSRGDHQCHKNNRHRLNQRRRASYGSSKSPGMVIKPIAPKEYDGKADARAYHHFVRESKAYLRDGKVKGC